MPPMQKLVGAVLSPPCLLTAVVLDLGVTLMRITVPSFLFLAQRLDLEIWSAFQ